MEEPCLFGDEWDISGSYGAEKAVLLRLEDRLAAYGVDRARLDDVKTAVAEGCLNALEHGNALSVERSVRIRLRGYRSKLVIRIIDEGNGFDHEARLQTDWGAKRASHMAGDGEPRGWGLHFMNALADYVRFGQENGRFYAELEFSVTSNGGGA